MLRKQTKKRKNIFSIPVTNIIGLLISSLIGVISVSIISFIISIILTKASNFPLYTEVYFCGCVGIGALISGFISAKKCSFWSVVCVFFIPLYYGYWGYWLFFYKRENKNNIEETVFNLKI